MENLINDFIRRVASRFRTFGGGENSGTSILSQALKENNKENETYLDMEVTQNFKLKYKY